LTFLMQARASHSEGKKLQAASRPLKSIRSRPAHRNPCPSAAAASKAHAHIRQHDKASPRPRDRRRRSKPTYREVGSKAAPH